MIAVQRLLSDYLQCELYHSLGAYHVAEERLASLAERIRSEEGWLEQSDDAENRTESTVLWDLVDRARRYNHKLGWYRYASIPERREDPRGAQESDDRYAWPTRDPLPDSLVLTDIQRFYVSGHDPSVANTRRSPWSSERVWDRIPRFYEEAIRALRAKRQGWEGDEMQVDFAVSLIAQRDGATIRAEDNVDDARADRRLNRYENRAEEARRRLAPEFDTAGLKPPQMRAGVKTGDSEPTAFLREIVGEDLTSGHNSLPMFVFKAQAEAHLSMHAVEAWRSMCLGEHAEALKEEEREWLNRELDRSIALSTFAYCVSRTAPWIFAKDEEERKSVFENVSAAWENVVPVRCMWIAAQVSLLALHRRAYARALKREPEKAYNDYHKLQQLARDTERRVQAAPLQADGALEFLGGLTAEAHHHIGELYRSAHAYNPALEHFEAATHRLEVLRKDAAVVDEVLGNSRWYVELNISHGKARYEMGRHKEALSAHLQAWRAFLHLLASETETQTNTDALDAAIDWLESVKFEPELRKSDITERVSPVIDQLQRINTVGRVGALAAEILLRLGHLLFVLNVGFFDIDKIDKPRPSAKRQAAQLRIDRTLAFACLKKACECDPYSTLVGADLLKARFRFNTWFSKGLEDEYKEALRLPPLKPVKEHWPRGGDDYEQIARVAEYLILKSRVQRFEDPEPEPIGAGEADALIARDLLLNLSMSTDSINVRKSQIHGFLTKERTPDPIPGEERSPKIEFICMRRYSSPFPLLPRPSAFRALGGGYLIRLYGPDREAKPFGVVVDPGVDFVENLYRSGYALSDIQMIFLTHDHVDHIGALDPLLSLLHVRQQLLRKEEEDGAKRPPGSQLKVLMSLSVFQRYDEVAQLHNPANPSEGEVEFICFEKFREDSGVIEHDNSAFEGEWPEEFEMLVMRSEFDPGRDGAKAIPRWEHRKGVRDVMRGHRDLSDLPSYGVCIRAKDGRGPSLAITSDTPHPPTADEDRYRLWLETWQPALESDVLLAHLGNVPVTELRRMDRASGALRRRTSERVFGPDAPALKEDQDDFKRIQRELEETNRDHNLEGQIQYAQWLRSHLPEAEKGDGRKSRRHAKLTEPVTQGWLPPPDHNFLAGILSWAREYKRVRAEVAPSRKPGHPGLFVIGELSEELGSMRGKVARRLEERVFLPVEKEKGSQSVDPPCVLTSDIGLHVCVSRAHATGKRHPRPRVEVLCTTCNLDMDRAPEERYHDAGEIYEVCVKGENEGIFYNCQEHDPTHRDDPAFLEKLERFDIFGR